MKAYIIDALSSNSFKSDNPYSGIHETQVCKCLDTMCLNPQCNQGGVVVVYALEGNGARPSHMGKGFSSDGKMYTLNTIEQHSVCYEVLTKQIQVATDISPTLEATDYKEPHTICYSVDCRNLCLNAELSSTLQAKGNGGFSYNYLNPVLRKNNEKTDVSG